MSWTYSLDITTPEGEKTAHRPRFAWEHMNEIKAAMQERMAQDHYFPLTDSEVSNTSAGEHKKTTLRVASSPLEEADKGYLFTKDADDKAELHWRDEDGHELQLVNKGAKALPITTPGDPQDGMLWIET